MMRRLRDTTGMAGVDLVLVMPVVLAALGFLVLAGRLATVRGDIAGVSRDAARAASLAQDYPSAQTAAEQAASAALTGRNVTCSTLDVTIADPSEFVPGGEVEVTLACEVQLADVALPGIPGSRVVRATSIEPIDLYRGTG